VFVSSYHLKAFSNCFQNTLWNKVTPVLPEADAELCVHRIFTVDVSVTAAETHLEIGVWIMIAQAGSRATPVLSIVWMFSLMMNYKLVAD
jgi:hypothetical protein